MKKLIFFLFFTSLLSRLSGQETQSPEEFLGYRLGEKFTPHHKVIEYFKHVSSTSGLVEFRQYGESYEGRPLILAFISNANNLSNLEGIRENNLRLSGIKPGPASVKAPVIVWLSYNVHGNESVSTEASMQTLFELVDPKNSKTKSWLSNSVVIIDPCINPDGRERYVNFYTSVSNSTADPNPVSREHSEPWPGGRTNHYYFDLNRDWAWQSQKETQERMTVYNEWLPQIHVDFHEQGYNEPYYFAPAAEPFHEDITKWQREFQTTIGKNNARYFDEKNWLYFTRERFDLLYPSYGDTYPTYNGAIGMTYEQGGSGRAGLAVTMDNGDTLTLRNRIDHHHTAGLSTIEVTSANAEKVVFEFQKYFENSKKSPAGKYKSYIVKADNAGRMKALTELLSKNGIEYGYGLSRTAKGYNYKSGKTESFNIGREDLVVSAYQAKSVLTKVLFEPVTFVSDSVTYDITAWAVPYAYGLRAYASTELLKPLTAELSKSSEEKNENNGIPVAYAANWGSMQDAKFLAELLKNNMKVRYSEVPFDISNKHFDSGALLIMQSGNEKQGKLLDKTVREIAGRASVDLVPIYSGFIEKGADLGSDKIRFIKKPRVGVIGGEGTSSSAFGEVWHFFEQQLQYPISVILSKDFNRLKLAEFDVLIFPDGKYLDIAGSTIQAWIESGGKLIALESAAGNLAGEKGFSLGLKEKSKTDKPADEYSNLISYSNRERQGLKNSIPGAIYRVDMDSSHPLGFGLGSDYYTLKLNTETYKFLEGGWNVGILKKNNYVSGFVGSETKKTLSDVLLYGVQDKGRGSVVYLNENPLFRSFWENGKVLFSNAVFMVGN